MKNMVPFLESKSPEDIVLLLELREMGSKERSQENIQLSEGCLRAEEELYFA